MKAAIYARVSTEGQSDHGYSIDDQLSSCRERLANIGVFDIVEYIDDGFSGEYIDRPAMDRLRNALQEKAYHIVILYDPDRLSRNLTDQLLLADEIEKSGAQLYFITGDYDASPEGKLFFSMKGAIAAYEKAKIRERTMRGKRAKAMKNKLVFNDNAFGYDFDSEKSMYVINEHEAGIVKLIFYLCATKHYSLRDIMLELKTKNAANKQGKPFTLSNIHRILKNEMYAGCKWSFKRYDKKVSQYKVQQMTRPREEWIPIAVPAIIDQGLYLAAQKQLTANRSLARRNAKREYLLRGIIKCAVCGRNMTGVTRKQRGKVYKYYVCNTHMTDWYLKTGKCTNTHIRADDLDDSVWNGIMSIATSGNPVKKFTRAKGKDDPAHEKLSRLKQCLTELQQKRISIIRWYNNNLIDDCHTEKELHQIQKEMAVINKTITAMQKEKPDKTDEILPVNEILITSTLDEKRAILLRSGCVVFAKGVNHTLTWFLE